MAEMRYCAPAGALLGLTNAEARDRLAEHGPNVVAEERPQPWRRFVLKFWGPVPWMLEAALLLQLLLHAYVEAAVVGALLLFNATLGFVQEGRAGAALALLKKRLAPTALALRDGAWARIAASELVPGDLVRLPLGALVPADAHIVSGSVLIDQSTLTGESVPLESAEGSSVYAGSLVRRGQAVAEVTATGAHTYFGRAAELVRVAHSKSTEQAAVFATARNLAFINGAIALAIISYGYAVGLSPEDLARLGLTALLGTIPVALPATFTLSAAFSAQTLATRGVLLTRLSAAHEAAAMDVLCADKTGTLTRNTLEVADVVPMPGFERGRVLALAALASSEGDQDPIDAAIRSAAAREAAGGRPGQLVQFIPFDPSTKAAEARVIIDGQETGIVKGAFEAIVPVDARADTARCVDEIAAQGHRVLAVAIRQGGSVRLVGLIALSDPPRKDSAALIADLRALGVRTLMVTGDSPVTAAAIGRNVGVAEQDIFARVVPEEKHRLVKSLQSQGHIVGMCGDGANDAPALKQAQIGIAVASATDVAKAAAGMVLTERGLGGVVFAVREGRMGFQRLLTYTFNMLVKKFEIVLFLAIGLILTGHAVLTPGLMVLLFVTNDFLSMSLTTDRPGPAARPSRWHMRDITAAAIVLGVCKLAFSVSILALGKYRFALGPEALDTRIRDARFRQPSAPVRRPRKTPHVELTPKPVDRRRLSG